MTIFSNDCTTTCFIIGSTYNLFCTYYYYYGIRIKLHLFIKQTHPRGVYHIINYGQSTYRINIQIKQFSQFLEVKSINRLGTRERAPDPLTIFRNDDVYHHIEYTTTPLMLTFAVFGLQFMFLFIK